MVCLEAPTYQSLLSPKPTCFVILHSETLYQCLWFLRIWLLTADRCPCALRSVCPGADISILVEPGSGHYQPSTQEHHRVFLMVPPDSPFHCVVKRSWYIMSPPALQRGPPSILNNRPTDTQSPSKVQIQKIGQQLHILSHSAVQDTESERQVGKLSPRGSTILDWIMIYQIFMLLSLLVESTSLPTDWNTWLAFIVGMSADVRWAVVLSGLCARSLLVLFYPSLGEHGLRVAGSKRRWRTVEQAQAQSLETSPSWPTAWNPTSQLTHRLVSERRCLLL